MNITGKVVTLRAIEKTDLEIMRAMLNDPEIEQMVVGWSFPVSRYQQELWFERNVNDEKNQRYIISISEDPCLGLATLTSIDWKNRRATHGIKLAKKENRAKGIGTDAVMAIMRYAFDELQLNRLDGSWLEDNVGSQKLYTKCGWSIEGRIRRCIFKNGVYSDLIIVGILSEEYYRLISENDYWGEG